MKRNICIIVPHKGLGDIVFHSSFIRSISEYHKEKIILFCNKSTKANLILKNNKFVKKIYFIDLKRPLKIFYIFKIFKIIFKMFSFNIDTLYYTGNSKWHKISFKIVSFFKKIKFEYNDSSKKFVISSLRAFLKKLSIKDLNTFDIDLKINNHKELIKKFNLKKKTCVFLSIDTSEDQIKIPNNLLIKMISKLKQKYNYIFINTHSNNSYKTKNIYEQNVIKTSKLNILKIIFLIRRSKLFIGAESGPAVLASLFCEKSIIFLSKNVRKETSKLPNILNRKYFNVSGTRTKEKEILKFL